MTLSDARKILGLGTDDDPRPFLVEFKEARDRIAEMVRTSPNETLAMRYQQGLIDFDRALAAVREHLEATGQISKEALPASDLLHTVDVPSVEVPVIDAPEVKIPEFEVPPIELPEEAVAEKVIVEKPVPEPEPPAFQRIPVFASPPPPKLIEPVVQAVAEPVAEIAPEPVPVVSAPVFIFPKTEPRPDDPVPPPPPVNFVPEKTTPLKPAPNQPVASKARKSAMVVWLLTVILLAIAAGLFYLRQQDDLALKNDQRLVELERQGAELVDKRRWPDATKIYDEMDRIRPKSSVAVEGRRNIAAGMAEEQSQFVGYWTGQARASLEAKRWEEAEAAAKQVLEKFPKEKEAAGLLNEIADARRVETDKTTLASAREDLQQRKWDSAIAVAEKILNSRPNDEDAKALLLDATVAKEKAATDLAKAKSLLTQAKALDQGNFDPQMVALLREANSLAPEDAEIKAQLEKIAAYARTVRVPGDYATPAEALANARDRDRIVLAAGTWQGPLIVNASVDLQGEGPDTTLVQCPATKGDAITFGPNSTGARISGISFRHESFDPGKERFSAALIRGATVDLVDCRFFDGSGHGLAVIEGGHAIVSRCRFSDNGWDGIAASGPGSLLEVRSSESLRNIGHGIESWDGAAVILTENRCENNSRNGIHADNGSSSITLEKNQLVGNREFGLVLTSAGSGRISGNIARENILGGFVVRSQASAVSFTANESRKNDGPGLILDIGLLAANYASNVNLGNVGQQLLTNTDLTFREPLPPDPTLGPATPPPPVAKPVNKRR